MCFCFFRVNGINKEKLNKERTAEGKRKLDNGGKIKGNEKKRKL